MARQTRAKATYILMSPRKVRLVIDLVRGKYIDDAVAILKATPNRAARVVKKLVDSAAANAENNHQLSRDSLKVKGGFADSGPSLKRINPRAQGRAYRILKRMSHVTVVVEESEHKPAAKRLARTVTKADVRSGRGNKVDVTASPKGKAAPKPAKQKEAKAEKPAAAVVEEQKTIPEESALEQTAATEEAIVEETEESANAEESGKEGGQ